MSQQQLALGTPADLDTAVLSCDHRVSFNRLTHPTIRGGWPAAIYCPTCRRPREIVHIVYRTAHSLGKSQQDLDGAGRTE